MSAGITNRRRGRIMRVGLSVCAVAIVALALGTGCRESRSEDPPIHLNLNMDHQAYSESQEAGTITVDGHMVFTDGRASRSYVEGTVAADPSGLRADDAFYTGKVGGQYVVSVPPQLRIPVSEQRKAVDSGGLTRLVKRGQARYDIYCVPCHDATGAGNGLVVQRGFTPPPSYHDTTRKSYPIGQLFEVVSQGGEAMPGFASQIPADDRWAIATYVRSLQHAHNAKLADLDPEVQKRERTSLQTIRAGQTAGYAIMDQSKDAFKRVMGGGR